MTFVQSLGAGCFGYAELFVDKKNNYYVIKKQKIKQV